MKSNDIRSGDRGENAIIPATIRRFKEQVRLRRVIAFLSAVVVFFTMSTLKYDADTLERIPSCGLEEHLHDEACLGKDLRVVCGMDEHAHTDACYQARPVALEPPVPEEVVALDDQVIVASPMEAAMAADVPEGVEPPSRRWSLN